MSNHVVPLKYAYAGSAAKTHDKLARHEDYQQGAGYPLLDTRWLHKLGLPPGSAAQIAEIGPGNGRHTAMFLQALDAGGYHCERYLGLDFSSSLRSMARHHVASQVSATVEIEMAEWDVETAPTGTIAGWRGDGPVLTCLLGQTLGNVENMPDTLANIRASLQPDDRLLLGLSARTSETRSSVYVAPYNSEIFRSAALEPLRAVGVDLDDVEFDVRYEDHEVFGVCTLRKETALDGVSFPAGWAIRCFRSRRFSEREVSDLLKDNGWSDIRWAPDDTGEHLIVLAIASDESE